MIMAKNIVFGIDNMELIPIVAGAEDAGVAVPGRSFSFANETEQEDFEANNGIIDSRYYGKKVTGSGEIAAHTPSVLAILGNGEVTTTGTAPNQSFVYVESSDTTDKKISIRTRSYSGDGTVVEAKVNFVRVSGPSFDLGTGSYAAVSFDFEGTGNASGELWQVTSFEGDLAVIEFD
jgi:hypothetical protein